MPPAAAPAAATLTCAAWEIWQDGLAERFTLPADLPPLRMLLVWDNLTGHKSVGMVLWLCQHGIMPLYTPLGGSWLNMAESIQRILKRRTLDGQHPQNPTEIGTWFQQTAQAWNQRPTPFLWNGKRRKRRRKQRGDARALGGSYQLGMRLTHPDRAGTAGLTLSRWGYLTGPSTARMGQSHPELVLDIRGLRCSGSLRPIGVA